MSISESFKDLKEVNLNMFLSFARGYSYLLQIVNVKSFIVAFHSKKLWKKVYLIISDIFKFGGTCMDPFYLKKFDKKSLKVTSRLKSVIFVTFYRPPSNTVNWLTLFDNSIEHLLCLKMPLIISEFSILIC